MLRRALTVAFLVLASAPLASAQFQYEVVQGFSASGAGPRKPSGPLLESASGGLYGTTPEGGTFGNGTVFQLKSDGSLITRSLGATPTDGAGPTGGLIQTPDGTLYGTTRFGGVNGSGTVFAIAPSNTFVGYDLPKVMNISHELVTAFGPDAALVRAADGNFYALVPGWPTISTNYYPPGIIQLTPAGVVSRFDCPAPVSTPNGPFVEGPDGYFYFTTTPTFSYPASSAFRFRPASGQVDIIHTFTLAEAPLPTGLVLGPDGNFYGASHGGNGTIFRMSPAGDVAVIHQFQPGIEGSEVRAPLTVGGDGNLYGVASKGGASNEGTIFRVSLSGAFDVLYTFRGGPDGGEPLASLIQARDGGLYGTASMGGPDGGGVVFRIRSTFSQPILSIDAPGAGATVGTSFAIAGWAIDDGAFVGSGIDAVHIYAFPNPGSGAAPIFLGAASLGIARPDIGAIFGSRFSTAGYGLISPGLAPGPYLIAALGRSTVTGTFAAMATRIVTVVAPQSQPLMSLDIPASNVTITGQIVVAGWALDLSATGGTTGVNTVHAWALPADGSSPVFLGVATYGVSRPDIGTIFGAPFSSSGYQLVGSLPPGRYTIAVFAWSTVAGAFNNMRLATNVAVQ